MVDGILQSQLQGGNALMAFWTYDFTLTQGFNLGGRLLTMGFSPSHPDSIIINSSSSAISTADTLPADFNPRTATMLIFIK